MTLNYEAIKKKQENFKWRGNGRRVEKPTIRNKLGVYTQVNESEKINETALSDNFGKKTVFALEKK